MSLPAINPMMSMYGGYDPYLMMALNSYNPYSSYMSVPAVQTAAPQTATVVTQPAASPTFQRGQSNAAGGKNKAARVVFPLIVAASLLIAGKKVYNVGQGETFFKRLGNGVKTMFSSAQSNLNKLMPKKPTVSKVNDKIVVTLPNKKNCISPGQDVSMNEINEWLVNIGEKEFVPGNITERFVDGTTKLAPGNNLRRVDFLKEINGTQYEVHALHNGKTIRIYECDGKTPIDVGKLRLNDNEKIYSQIKADVNDIFLGKAQRDGIKFNRIELVHTNPTTGLISHIKSGKNQTEELVSCISDKFALDHDKVITYADHNPMFRKAVEAAENGDWNKLKVKTAEVPASTAGGVFIIDGKNNILGFRPDNSKYIWKPDSEKYHALSYELKQNDPNFFKDLINKDHAESFVYEASLAA